ncbi:MAG: succinate--CoA ligase subunit beta, partial [Candidatus Eisenbacteria bacterium]|nr:succinate--CoA ligase subunit beta [Candidatus Eisenbacteria bacterium]
MNLHEYQAKTVFGSFGIPIIEGRVATTPEEARAHAEAMGGMVVVKAQVHTGGRGKAGGVKLAKDAAEAEARARDILGLDIKGHIVETILIVPASDISKEYYLSITLDRGSKRPVIIASAEGGIDIEEVAAKTPEKIFRYHLDRPGSFKSYEARLVASKLESDPKIQLRMARIVEQLVNCFWATDASLVEINPLITNPEGQVIALDAKMSVDDNALYKHPHLVAFREDSDEHAKAAREMGLSYVPLEGNVGCIVNGAGLAMATMDLIKHFGGEPA